MTKVSVPSDLLRPAQREQEIRHMVSKQAEDAALYVKLYNFK